MHAQVQNHFKVYTYCTFYLAQVILDVKVGSPAGFQSDDPQQIMHKSSVLVDQRQVQGPENKATFSY